MAPGPIATLFVPTALLSARLELAWKYLIPPPFWMLAMFWLVALSWLPFTASVLVLLKVPAIRLVIFTPPAGPPAPPVAPRVIVLPPTASYFTATFAVFATFVFRAPSAAPTVVWLVAVPETAPVVLMLFIGWLKLAIPPADTVAPAPSVVAVDEASVPTAWLVPKSWLPFTASVLTALSWPAARFVSVRGDVAEPILTVLAGFVPANV